MSRLSKAFLSILFLLAAPALLTAQIQVPTPISDAHFYANGVPNPAHSAPGDFGTINVGTAQGAYNLEPHQDPFTGDWIYEVKKNGQHEGWIRFHEPFQIEGFNVYPWSIPGGPVLGYLIVFN